MSGLSKLGTALTVVFVVSLVALLVELVYVLRRRFAFRHRSTARDAEDRPEFCGCVSPYAFTAGSKELLYFLCWKQQSRVEPERCCAPGPTRDPDVPAEAMIDVLKLQGMYGPSRAIKEEREDVESEKSLPLYSAEKVPKQTERMSLEECLKGVAGDSPNVTVTVEEDIHTTPFSTPCASPVYYTPSASPTREWDSGLLVDSDSLDKAASFLRLEVQEDGKVGGSYSRR